MPCGGGPLRNQAPVTHEQRQAAGGRARVGGRPGAPAGGHGGPRPRSCERRETEKSSVCKNNSSVRSDTLDRPEATARERLLTAALERFAADTPVAVSLDEIRRDAGVSVGALYHHFADKTALVDELYIELTAQFQAEFLGQLRGQATAEAGIKGGVALYLRWVTRNRAGARLLLGHRPTDPQLIQLNRTFLTELKSWWSTHQHYGTLRPLPLDLAHALWFGPAHEYTRQWLDRSQRRTPASATDLLARAAWETLKEPA